MASRRIELKASLPFMLKLREVICEQTEKSEAPA
jgi:hypothetical protein